MKTLLEFQLSRGVRGDEQIWILDNPAYYANGFDWIERWRLREDKWYTKIKNRLTLSRKIREEFIAHRLLYFGYPERSIDDLSSLKHLFKEVGKKRDSTFVVLVGKGDYELNDSLLSQMPENIVGIAANNAASSRQEVEYMPMGRDFRNESLFEQYPPCSDKKYTCYCNFSTNTHPVRSDVYEMLKSHDYILFQHMGEFLKYPIAREEFIQNLRESKFCICPRGNAIDTFRMWDSLYLGTIPIVVREARYHSQLEDLPILFLDSYADFAELTGEYLNEQYDKMLRKKFDYRKLELSYWLARLTSKLEKRGNSSMDAC